MTGTVANPSNPSVKLTPLDVPIITKKAKWMIKKQLIQKLLQN